MRLERKHPLAIRWFHWINFPLLAVMIWSGILIYWAYPAYVKLDQTTWRALHVNNRLAEGMALHFFFMWLFGVNGVLYVLYTLISGEWRELVPRRGTLREAWNVLLHDLRIRKEPLPRKKFNGAQQIAYTSVIVMGVIALETPDRGYYVGLDIESALHPQTLLAFEINDSPLPLPHGAPLRLAIPVKYGIKNIKRIGTIRYTDIRPADFWGERGYDWYAGH